MAHFVALIAATTLALIALVHVYWALGGRVAKSAALPEIDGRPAFTPRGPLTLLVAAALSLAALLLAVTGGVLEVPLPRSGLRLLTFGLALVFVARAIGDFRLVGFFKRVKGSRFATLDSLIFAPLCLLLGLAAAWVAIDAP